jgi:transposase-like protein
MSSKNAGVRRRRQHSAELKARVALEAIQERRTLNEIASEHGVHPTQVSAWKRQALESLSTLFDGGAQVDGPELKRQESELFEQIGRLKMELEWLKKKYGALRSSTGGS